MKKLAVLLALAVAVPLFAADKLNPEVARALTNALQNERQAAARYDAWLAKAELEGYLGAANLFRACAKAERIHASRFTATLKKYGVAVPDPEPCNPHVDSTADNLSAASAAEQAERDTTYKEAAKAATAGHNDDVAALFEVTRDTETEHANLLGSANRSLDSLKAPKAYWICRDCGFTTDVHLPLCPSCRVQHALVEVEP